MALVDTKNKDWPQLVTQPAEPPSTPNPRVKTELAQVCLTSGRLRAYINQDGNICIRDVMTSNEVKFGFDDCKDGMILTAGNLRWIPTSVRRVPGFIVKS